jgi:hypothetical protein
VKLAWHRKATTTCSHLFREAKKINLIEKEGNIVVTRDSEGEKGWRKSR